VSADRPLTPEDYFAQIKILAELADMSRDERDLILHEIRRLYPTHCFLRDCLRGSSAGDRFTALADLSTFSAGGCECSCAACCAAGTHYAAEAPL
jgi:hypothetical protein